MKRLFAIAGLVALTVSSVWAVKPVVLESGDTSTAFIGPNAFINAYNAADDGDVIYLPGFQFSVPNPFEKNLTIYGAGYHPDDTEASGLSMLTGTFNLRAGASGSHFEGIRFSGQIVFCG